ncbi:MAG: hypothetical protein SFV15_02935 [Polyangiaceae bacterium]|nr:hypothetical protein [Polyangiaceae bacterium]
MLAGGLTFGTGYLGALGYSASSDIGPGSGWLLLPVLGPWAAINARHFGCKNSSQLSQEEINGCLSLALGELKTITVLTFSGLVQVVGATLFVVGYTDKDQQWLPHNLQLDAGPVGRSGRGVLVRGTF